MMIVLTKYIDIKSINNSQKVYLVQNIQDNSFYVKKILNIYDKKVYDWLLQHPILGIPEIKEIIEENNQLIVIEEYIAGKTLEYALSQGTIFSTKQVKQIILSLCNILNNINNQIPLVNRDIKPSNIILKDNGKLYLVDFNTAKINYESKTRDTILLGTQGYAAPEQYGFGSSDVRTDIYAIGVLMKEMVTGSIVLSNDYSSPLKPIIQKCTMLDPKNRYKDYDSLIKDLKHNKFTCDNKYLPVGFRSGNILHILLASMWYLMLILLCSSLTFSTESDQNLTVYKIGTFIAFFAATQFTGNYLDCQNSMHLNKIKFKLFRIIAILFIDQLILIVVIMLTAMIA